MTWTWGEGRAGKQVVPEGAAQILGEPVKGVLGHDHIDDLEVESRPCSSARRPGGQNRERQETMARRWS